jgi:polysaccharide biosynthesis/export protein
MNRQTILLTVLVALVGLLAGCDMCDAEGDEAVLEYPQSFLQKDWPSNKGFAARATRPAYRMRPGDQLEIIYHIQSTKLEDNYKIKIRDILDVAFPFHGDLTQSNLEVQSDGTIQLQLVGSVPVYDKTIKEVEEDLKKAYSKYLKDPQLTINFKESKRDLRDLQLSISTAPRGYSRLVPVAPDGTMGLPLIGVILAGGRTVDELRAVVNSAYHDLGMHELETTVNLETIAPTRVYVMGELKRPGLVINSSGSGQGINQITLLQAIAQAGGYIPQRADLSKVLVVRHKGQPTPQVAVVNLHKMLLAQAEKKTPYQPNSEAFRYDIWLQDGDVVYVPTTKLAKRADYIEYVWTRGIYSVVPISYGLNASYSAVDTVDWLGPSGSGL